MIRDMHGNKLVPGVNVDPIDIRAGLDMASDLGYDDGKALMVTEYALTCQKRGEEDQAQKVWLHEFPNDLTSWTIILAAAMAAGIRTQKEKA